MGVIKTLLLKLEELENKYKILQGKFDKLKIRVDLVNTKPKELPDAFTYKPQQPYMGGTVEDLKLELIKEATVYIADGRWFYEYIPTNGKMRVFLLVKEVKGVGENAGVPYTNEEYYITWEPGTNIENGEYKIEIGLSFKGAPGYYYNLHIHYKIYEFIPDCGDLQIIDQ